MEGIYEHVGYVAQFLRDLWSFNFASGNWIFRGSLAATYNQVGSEGWPASRLGPVTWTSNDGLLFLFGGMGCKIKILRFIIF